MPKTEDWEAELIRLEAEEAAEEAEMKRIEEEKAAAEEWVFFIFGMLSSNNISIYSDCHD